jgi:hypothetical protein
MTPSSGEISVDHSKPAVQAVFSTCKIDHNKNENLTICEMAIAGTGGRKDARIPRRIKK